MKFIHHKLSNLIGQFECAMIFMNIYCINNYASSTAHLYKITETMRALLVAFKDAINGSL